MFAEVLNKWKGEFEQFRGVNQGDLGRKIFKLMSTRVSQSCKYRCRRTTMEAVAVVAAV